MLPRLALSFAMTLAIAAGVAHADDGRSPDTSRDEPPGMTAAVPSAAEPFRLEIATRLGFEELGFATDLFKPLVEVTPATLEIDVGAHRGHISWSGYVRLLGGLANEPYDPSMNAVTGVGIGMATAFRGKKLPLFLQSELGGVVQGLGDYQVSGVECRGEVGFHVAITRGLALQLGGGIDFGLGSGLWGAWTVSLGLVHDAPARGR